MSLNLETWCLWNPLENYAKHIWNHVYSNIHRIVDSLMFSLVQTISKLMCGPICIFPPNFWIKYYISLEDWWYQWLGHRCALLVNVYYGSKLVKNILHLVGCFFILGMRCIIYYNYGVKNYISPRCTCCSSFFNSVISFCQFPI